ncbi:UNVERIFIED_CONTAM: putative PurR-regulated permease PerM [Acetivibrio alkalicellulosi]
MINISKNRRNILLDIALIVLILIIVLFFGRSITNVIMPFIYALVAAYALSPVVSFLVRKGIKRIYAILIVFLGIFIVLISASIIIIPKFYKDISVFISDEIPIIIDYIKKLIDDFKERELWFVPKEVYDYLNMDSELKEISLDGELKRIFDVLRNAFGQLSNVLLETTSTLLDIVLTPIITFYYLKDQDKLINFFMKPLNKRAREKINTIAGEIDAVIGGFIRGQLIVAAFVGVLTGVGCRIIGVPYSITIGLVAGLTNIIPYFGPWVGGILPVILALMNNPISALWVIILIIIVQQVESSFVSPQIMSRSIGLHPLVVIFSVLLFGNAFGIIGMIIGVPLTGTIIVLSKHLLEFRNSYRVNKSNK